MKSIVVSAHNPMTGPRHLGHYVSTMIDWPRLQRDHELFVIIDDLIAAILYPNIRDQIESRSLQVAKEFLATGVDFSRNHLVLTSMVPEVHELAMFTSMAIDHAWCYALYKESFGGLLNAYQRRELGLPHLPSIAEVVYPQIHLATLTVGLGAQFFQGGEEMKGYLPILEAIAEGMPAAVFQMPSFLPGKSTFLPGTDGRHMASENAIYLAADARAITERLSQVKSIDPLRRLLTALGQEEAAIQLIADSAKGGELKTAVESVSRTLTNMLAPYRESKATKHDVAEVLETSAIAARSRIRQALIKVKTALRLPGY